jgi:hypothetical protein
MLKDADQALYVAKNGGKDRIEVCAPENKTNLDQAAANY